MAVIVPQPTDIPSVRDPIVSDGSALLVTPAAGYPGCIVLYYNSAVPGAILSVVLFVGSDAPSATLSPPDGTLVTIMDVPAGFSINNGDAISIWIGRSGVDATGGGIGGGTPPVTGHP